MFLRRRKVLIVSPVVLLLLLMVLGLVEEPGFAWKENILILKYSGSLPNVGWTALLRGAIPEFFDPWIDPLGYRLVQVNPKRTSDERDEPCPVLWDTAIGDFWGRSTERNLLSMLMREQLVERIYQHEPAVVRTGDVVFDIGAHVGTFSRFALSQGARLVVAFEPEPTNIPCFKRNFEKEISLGRVILVEAAVWEQTGTVQFETGLNSATGSVHPDKDGASFTTIPAVTIDDAVSQLKLDRVDFIKMDIEGSERHALRGARRTLSVFGPRMVVCVYHRPDDRKVIPEIVFNARPAYKLLMANDKQDFFYVD